MRTIIVTDKQANKRIDKVIRDSFPSLPQSALFKAFRKRDVKVNGIRIKEDYTVSPGDKVEIYIIDDILDGTPISKPGKSQRGFCVAYEDANIIVVSKEQGVQVHPDNNEQAGSTLIDFVQEYLSEKGEFDRNNTASFPPSLCHRLDRNTGGLLIIAKNKESHDILLDKIKNREIKKFYQCLVKGRLKAQKGELKAYLEKDENKSRVYIHNEKKKNSVEIITKYRVLSYEKDISRLEVELITGRTHQIRAHLAYIGHPIIGDGKYGTNSINRSSGFKNQALWAYKILFDFKEAGMLNYLKGKQIEIKPGF